MKNNYKIKRVATIICALITNFSFAQNWQSLNCPAPGGQLGDIDRTNNTIYATRLTGGFFKSTDAGVTWNDITANYPAGQTQNFVCLNSGNILLYMFAGSTFSWYKSTDQGTTWTLISGSTPIGGGSVYQSSNGTLYWVPGYNGSATIKTSTDEGATWTSQSAVLKHIAFTSNGDAYGLRYDSGSGMVKLSKSTDNGVTWNDLAAANLPATCEQIVISPNGNIYVQNGSPVHKSIDNGNTFTSIDSSATAIYTDYNNNLFAGKPSQFIVTSNGGTTWQNATAGLSFLNTAVGRIWAHPNGTTYASNYDPSTASWGIYKYGTVSGITEISNKELVAVYPNPVNDELNLTIDKRLTGEQLFIYDCLGQLVMSKQITNEQTTISTEQLTNGIYFLRVNTKGVTQNTKFIKQ